MTFSFSSFVRLIVVLALGSTMLAIGVAKLDPPKPIRRAHVATRYYGLNEYFMNFADRSPRWLDADTGRVITSPLDDGEVLEAASCSPWVEDGDHYEVAGRWSSRTRQGPMSISTDFGLGRYSFPEGRVIDHISTDVVPVGPPCWFPGDRARILFAAGDGELYHFAFEPEFAAKAEDPEAKGDARPISLSWRCPKPGLGQVYLSDLTWPEDPRLRGYVVVSLREQSRENDSLRCLTRTRLWWLKLDHAGTEIVEAGPLLVPEPDRPQGDQRTPTVGTLADGRAVVAYLSENVEKQGWELRLAPIELRGDHHVPAAMEEGAVTLSAHCQPSHPSFSADGRWLNAVALSNLPDGQIIRLPVSKLFEEMK